MKISKQQLIEMDACKGGLCRFIEQTNHTDEPVDVLSLIGGKSKVGDLLWLAGETLPKEKIARFACDVALIVIELLEPYKDEYDLLVEFLRRPDKDLTTAIKSIANYIRDDHDTDFATFCATTALIRAADSFDAELTVHATTTALYTTTATVAAASNAEDTKEQINELLVKLFKEC